jgi:hypothetical protein
MLKSARPSTPRAAALRMRGRVSKHARPCCSSSLTRSLNFPLESGNPGRPQRLPLDPRFRGGDDTLLRKGSP